MAYDFDQADTLLYSDDPEALKVSADSRNAVHVATPSEAILFDAQVGGGRKRLFYYHQNFDANDRTVAARLVNVGTNAVTLNLITYVEQPDGNIVDVGHRSVVGFLRALIAGAWAPLLLQPAVTGAGGQVLAVSTAAAGQLTSAFVEMDIPAGAQIKVQVISASSQALIESVGENGPRASHDGIGRSGVYNLVRGGIVGDYAPISWATNAPWSDIEVPSPPNFQNGQVPPMNPGQAPQPAVFGVFTRREITLTNPTGADMDVGIYLKASAGDSTATCMLNDDVIELGTMTAGPAEPRPPYELARFTVPANNTGQVKFNVLATVDPSGRGPQKLTMAQVGTLTPPPASTSPVVFLPGGPPWQA